MSMSQFDNLMSLLVGNSREKENINCVNNGLKNNSPTKFVLKQPPSPTKWRTVIFDLLNKYVINKNQSSDSNMGNLLSKCGGDSSLCSVSHLYDVLNSSKTLAQEEFLQYLQLYTTNGTAQKTAESNLYNGGGHQRTLINSPNVPFSSDLGLKLMRSTYTIGNNSQHIHERRLERLERYLSTSTTVIDNVTTKREVDYEVSCSSKRMKCSHFYVPPSRQRRKTQRLSLKATLLRMFQCKPCSVRLERVMDLQQLKDKCEIKDVRDVKVVLKPLDLTDNKRKVSVCSLSVVEASVILTPIDNFCNIRAKSALTKPRTRLRKSGACPSRSSLRIKSLKRLDNKR